ncbi:tetratricopeptide repeat protein [Candidatus Magnetobacterium casense]|uniref:Tetratricopeptide repeat protein n=1 Tax=Candidatus Magnetobacterium casense TaxID=1455061 RepID=A0ABS6RYN8_9BACT|nr:tetratricopeptide repeat protein [Candidatus Magnetobacterium casensis]MBV6341761.1 tetratricopeptide repeat protein [Candidatus Magnetobacterium casensis]
METVNDYIKRNYVLMSMTGVIVFIGVFLLYLPTLYNAPVWDDLHVINTYTLIDKNNPYNFLFNSYLYYRPLVYISMFADHRIWGTNPFGYHLTNCLIHSTNALLLFVSLVYFLPIPRQSTTDKTGDKTMLLLPLLSSLLFASHPINTEAVAWISGRTDLLTTTFFLLALLSFMAYERDRQTKAMVVCGIFFFFSLMSKENGISFAIMAVIYALMTRMNKRHILITIGVLSTVVLLYFVLRKGGGLRDVLLKPGSKGAFLSSGVSAGELIHTVVYGCAFYVEKLLLPINLTLMPKIPANPVYIPVFLLPAVCGIIFTVRGFRTELFYLLWVTVTLMPSLTIMFSQVANPLGERYLYLPSAGFASLAVLAGYRLLGSKTLIVTATVLLLTFSYMTHDRLKVWKNDLALWQDTVEKTPDSVVAHTNYAIALLQEKNLKAAENELTIAMKHPIKSPEQTSIILNTLATLQMKRNDYVKAQALLHSAIAADPNNLNAYNNLGYLYMRQSELNADDKPALLTKATALFEKALSVSPTLIHTRFNLGLCYLELDKLNQAESAFSAVIDSEPGGELSKNAINFLRLTIMRKEEKLKTNGLLK